MSEPVVRKRGRRGSPESWSVDAHVGQRVRMRRTLLGMSQEKLGEAIGLTFQQVQKYERGSNRISAGTLYRLGQVLDVPVSFFFDCYDDPQSPKRESPSPDAARIADNAISRREARLLRLWRSAPENVSDELLSLLSSLSPHLRDTQDDDSVGSDSVSGIPLGTAPPWTSPGEGRIPAAAMPSKTRAAPGGPGGGKAGVKTAAKPLVKAEPAGSGQRRRHGAVWDPTDIYRAGKSSTGKSGKTSG